MDENIKANHILDYKLTFGKYKGYSIFYILQHDESYVKSYLCKYIDEKYFKRQKELCEYMNIKYDYEYPNEFD